jgi:Tol biopolymer transport system component/DNA-binding winged helix-turn-helix (wHTH) protein
MPEKGAADGRIRFGSFEADPRTKELFKEGTRIPLANQSFIALATLLERPGELVSREELRRRLWPDNRVVDFDQGMNAIINRLRDALGAGPNGAGLIETLPRRGYRFVGTVQYGGRNGAQQPGQSGGLESATAADLVAHSARSANAAASVQDAHMAGSSSVAAPAQGAPATESPIATASAQGAYVAGSSNAAAPVQGAHAAGSANAAAADLGTHATGSLNAAHPDLGAYAAGVANTAHLDHRIPGARRGPETSATPLSNNPRRPGTFAVTLGILVILLLGWATTSWLTRPSHPQLANLKLTPLTSLVGREVAPTLEPAGDRLLFAWNGAPDAAGRFDLYSRSIDSERLFRITHDSALAMRAAWAPGAPQIALTRQTDHDSGVFLASPQGGAERLLAAANFLNESFMQLAWSPDRQRIAYAAVEPDGWSHIDVVDVTGSNKHSLARPSGCADAGAPAFSSDGRWLAFVCTTSVALYSVYVTDLADNSTRALMSLQGVPQGLAWSVQGDALIVANDSGTDSGIWRITLDGQSSRLFHPEGPLGPGIAVTERGIAFVRESNVVDIWRADLTEPSSASENLISSTRTQLVPAYSPDGARVAFQSTRSGSPEIWLSDADGRNPVKLTSFNGPLTGAPSWCQDGRRIAFDSRASGSSAIYVLDVFEGHPRRLETSQANLSLPSWSEDCRWIIASNGRSALYRVPAAGGQAEPFTGKRTYRAITAGSKVIFNVVGNDGVELWSKPVEGGPEAPLPDMKPLRVDDSWTANSRGVYFTSSSPRATEVRFYDFATRAIRVVRSLERPPDALGGLGIAVSADQHWLLYTRSDRSESDIMMLQPDSPK